MSLVTTSLAQHHSQFMQYPCLVSTVTVNFQQKTMPLCPSTQLDSTPNHIGTSRHKLNLALYNLNYWTMSSSTATSTVTAPNLLHVFVIVAFTDVVHRCRRLCPLRTTKISEFLTCAKFEIEILNL